MREAAVPGYRLSKAKPSMKVLTTLGLLGLFFGLLGSVLLTVWKTGFSPESVSKFYLGSEVESSLDDLMSPSSPRPILELAEITHMHLMGGSLLLFLLCHLISLCELKDKVRTVIYSVSFLSFLSTFLTPWGISLLSSTFSYLYGPSIIILMGSLIVLIFIPLREMWGGR